MKSVAERASVSVEGLGGLRYAILIALLFPPSARAGIFLRDSIPDLFDLGAARGARVAMTAPDSGPNTYNIDAAAGAWTEITEVSTTGVFGLVAELHRSTLQRNPVNTRRFVAAAWSVFDAGGVFLPTTEGAGWRRDSERGASSYQAYFKTSLVVPRPAAATTLPLWHALIWSTSYAPIGGGIAGAGSPAVGVNYESADTGGTGHVVRGRAEYTASFRGERGPLGRLNLDFSWVYQRRLGGSGSLAAGRRDLRRTRISLGYAFTDGVALVAERIDGEDPFEGTGDQRLTTVALRIRLGDGPPSP